MATEATGKPVETRSPIWTTDRVIELVLICATVIGTGFGVVLSWKSDIVELKPAIDYVKKVNDAQEAAIKEETQRRDQDDKHIQEQISEMKAEYFRLKRNRQ